ncbi:SDR family NAD(P)-dependent oxidoreductase [Actinomarinicola tropica]|uniref:SDR family NAD(P)-dependent oxidoreductase n=1 Tax=Actinomarinicola tropica TaxID=2789776 RepID=A0A5Q2RNX6_9ACTN|nr:SDR family NAD(P)-dependent oxidoreductase [Actinomarinicola tropica]QGG95797.1 SDR family NAD(P)-dependent oxidoreductase [Actinomarinicola tropica]
MDELSGKVAVVTGGASGIGRAMVDRFATEGMRIAVGDIEEAALVETVEELRGKGVDAIGVVVDVSDPDSMAALADEVREVFGGWDVVCLNAGVGAGGPIWELGLTDWQWVLDVNLWGVVHGLRSFVPAMVERGDGHVVITASLAGLLAGPNMGPYNASKFAAVAIGETLAADLEAAGSAVGVSILCPAWVSTRIYESSRNRPDHLRGEADERAAVGREDAAAFFAAAMPPDEVAERVITAVREGTLHILTHEGTDELVRARTARILGDL